MVSRPALNRALIRYDPSPQDQLKASDDGLSGLFVVRYDVNRELDGGDLLVGVIHAHCKQITRLFRLTSVSAGKWSRLSIVV